MPKDEDVLQLVSVQLNTAHFASEEIEYPRSSLTQSWLKNVEII